MENWVQEVISKWKLEGVKLNPPATIAEIENTEAVLNFKFPKDFRDFYLQTNGFDGFDMQQQMFTLWPLEVIVNEFDANFSTDKNFIGFCDYLIASHSIGFSKSWPGVFKDYEHFFGKAINETFSGVVTMINKGDEGIY